MISRRQRYYLSRLVRALVVVTVLLLKKGLSGPKAISGPSVGPQLENLTEAEVQYARMYWDYKVSEHITSSAGPEINDLSESIGPQLDYHFVIPWIDRSSGLTYVGNAARLRLVLERARRGEAIRVGALGGSITAGQGVQGRERSYAKLFLDWLNAALPPQHSLDPGSRGNETPSQISGERRRSARVQPVNATTTNGAPATIQRGPRHRSESPGRSATLKRHVQQAQARGGNGGPLDASEVSGAVLQSNSHSRSSSRSSRVGGSNIGRSGSSNGGRAGARGAGKVPAIPSRRGRALRDADTGSGYAYEQGGQAGGGGGSGTKQRIGHLLLNGAVPGTTSSYTCSCLYHHLIPSPDLVLVEFAMNDAPVATWTSDGAATARRPFERLLRKLLQLPSKPAVVLVNMFTMEQSKGHYWHTAERDFQEFATYYGLPSVSLKAALLPSTYVGANPEHMALPVIFNGGPSHPGRGGHVVVAELLITLCLGLLRADTHVYPAGTADHLVGSGATKATAHAAEAAAEALEAVASRPLPAPICPGNYGSMDNLCFIEDELKSLVDQPVVGWNWTDEGRGKWGFVAKKPGQKLQIKLSTQVARQRHPEQQDADSAEDQEIILQIGYLQSYSGMGTAHVHCVEGCSCRPVVIDAYDKREVSITSMRDVKVTQHPKCVLQLTSGPPSKAASEATALASAVKRDIGGDGRGAALDESGHKFKLMGIVLGEELGAKTGLVNFFRDSSHDLYQRSRSIGR